MSSDFDFLDDVFLEQASNAVRVAGKFRPKVKFGPKSGNRPAKLYTIPADANVSQLAAPACLPTDLPKFRPCSTATTDLLSKVPAAAEHPANCDNIICSGGHEDSRKNVTQPPVEADGIPFHVVENLLSGPSVFDSSGDSQAESGKASREAEYLFSSMESLGDDPFRPTHSTRVDFVSLPPDSDAEALNEGSSGSTFLSDFSFESPTVAPCNPTPAAAPSQYADAVLLDGTGDLQMGHECLEKEDATTYSSLELLDGDAYGLDLTSANTTSESGPGKIRVVSTKKSSASTLPDESEPVGSSKDPEPHPLESGPFEEGLSSFTPNSLADSPIWQSYNPSSIDSSSNTHEMQESAFHVGTTFSDKPVDTNEVPQILQENEDAKSSRKLSGRVSFQGITSETFNGAAEMSVPIVEGKQLHVTNVVPGISDENESAKLSRKTRKRVSSHGTIDENENVEDEHCEAIDEDRVDDPLYSMEDDISKVKRAPKRSKTPAAEFDQQVRGHKKASAGSGSVNSEQLKQKFSHSTRRSRKLANKELLETPEEDIDPKKLIIKDLILLAEIKERKMIKEAAALKKSTANKRSDNALNGNSLFGKDDDFVQNEPLNSDDDRPRPKLNYHSFMVTPRERWSVSDTQLFYEAIRHFGTDFAMVQQMFPGRTRHQVKLKYKAEERKHPIQIADALMQRSKDRSHFELVMERLRAQAEQDSNRGSESPAPSGENEEEVENHNRGAEATVLEQHDVATEEKEDAKDLEHTEVHSPGKAEETDNAYDWSDYKSFDAYSFDDTEITDNL